jgi:hypothetical protein
MNWNEHIISIKAKAEKNEHHQMPSPHQMGGDQGNLLTIPKMIILSKHLKIWRRGLRNSIQGSVKKV